MGTFVKLMRTAAILVCVSAKLMLGDCREPQYDWTESFGGPGPESVGTVAVDNEGRVYVAGGFEHTVDFDPTGDTDFRTARDKDIFVTMFEADGSYGWTLTYPADYDQSARAVGVDSVGDVFVTGEFTDIVDFDPGEGVDLQGMHGIHAPWLFVTKINHDGTYSWTRTVSGNVTPDDLAVAPDGSVAVSGGFDCFPCELDFDPTDGVDLHASNGGEDVFVTKLNADGSYAWTHTFGATILNAADRGYEVAVDQNGNVMVAGRFSGMTDFDPGPGTDIHTPEDFYGVFVTKFQGNGTYEWTVAMERFVGGLAMDSNGNTLVASPSQYLTKITPDGVVDWSVQVFPQGEPAVAVDSDDSILCTGSAGGAMQIRKFTNDGDLIWHRTISGTSSVTPYAISADSLDNVIIQGRFYGTVDFDPSSDNEDLHTSNGSHDVFVIKLLSTSLVPEYVSSNPPTNSIDARQDLSVTGTTPQGISQIRITFSCAVVEPETLGLLTPDCFELTDTDETPPLILSVVPVEGLEAWLITLSDPISPGAWTTLSGVVANLDGVVVEEPIEVRIGFLPGDVNGDGTSTPSDILAIIDCMNGVSDLACTNRQTDVNRSNVTDPSDILRVIDMLNGANATRSWLDVSLPK